MVKLDFKELIKTILRIIFLLAVVYIIYQVLVSVFGGSWATENIILGGIGIIITWVFTMVAFMFIQSQTLGRLEERTKHFENRFLNIENRLSKIEEMFTKVENRLIAIERKI